MKVVAIVPALDERDAIEELLRAAPLAACDAVVVVDGGSRDGTAETARRLGATVVEERRRGYGRAMHRGVAAARALRADVLVFLDGSGASDPSDLAALLAPVARGEADLVAGSRTRGGAEPGALRPLQRLGNRVATEVIARVLGFRYTDVGSFRVVGAAALEALSLSEETYGWPLQLHIRALSRGLRVREVPVAHRRRRSGRSKVSGSVRGQLGATLSMLRVLVVECARARRAR